MHHSVPSVSSDVTSRAQPACLDEESPSAGRSVIALVGLAFEARIASGPGVVVVCRNTERKIASSLNDAIKRGCRSIISFGVAGGLAPHLLPGSWVVASSVIDAHQTHPTDKAWSEKLKMIPGASHAPIVGADTAITHPVAKQRMHARTGAAVVDMESHLAARLALTHGLNFAAVRVVIDPAHRTVPAAALAGMLPGGRTNVTAVMLDLMARPSQLPELVRVAVDAYSARRALFRAGQVPLSVYSTEPS